MHEVKSESGVSFFVTPGFGEALRDALPYSQAVRIGNRVEISGQGGWDDEINFPESLEDEIERAFENVQRTLATAGASWADVVHVNSYHVPSAPDWIGDEPTQAMARQLRKWMPDRAPIWTQTGVAALGAPKMRVEIRVTAIVGE